MSPSGIHVNKSVVLLILAITVGIIVFNNYKYFSTFLMKKNSDVEMTKISQAVLDKAKTLDVETHKIKVKIKDGQVCTCNYVGAIKQNSPPNKQNRCLIEN